MCIRKLIGRFTRSARTRPAKAEPASGSAQVNDMIRALQQKLMEGARENGRPRTGA